MKLKEIYDSSQEDQYETAAGNVSFEDDQIAVKMNTGEVVTFSRDQIRAAWEMTQPGVSGFVTIGDEQGGTWEATRDQSNILLTGFPGSGRGISRNPADEIWFPKRRVEAWLDS